MVQLEAVGDLAHQHFKAVNQVREQALSLSREAIRSSANSIRAVHRNDFELAEQLQNAARMSVEKALATLVGYPELLYAGYVQDAQKEYAESVITYAIVRRQSLPGPDEIGVSWPAYLNGLGEAAGELRRYVLDQLRGGALDKGEYLLQSMGDIYDLLVTIDYPDAMTGGLRRTTDMVRGVLERTRGDLTMALRQEGLERRLADLETNLSSER
jgi:translin